MSSAGISSESPLPASPPTVGPATDDNGDGGNDGVKLASVNTTLKPASTGDMEFLSCKTTQHAKHEITNTVMKQLLIIPRSATVT